MLVSKKDVEFIAKKTNLSLRKTKLLTEEERDLSLIIDQLSKNLITKEELQDLSFQTIIKYMVFHFSNNTIHTIAEKIYVCKMIEKFFPIIAKSKFTRGFPKDKNNKDFAEYCFILIGFFSHRLKEDEYKKYKNYLIWFRAESDFPEIYNNLNSWLDVFNKMKMKTEEIFV